MAIQNLRAQSIRQASASPVTNHVLQRTHNQSYSHYGAALVPGLSLDSTLDHPSSSPWKVLPTLQCWPHHFQTCDPSTFSDPLWPQLRFSTLFCCYAFWMSTQQQQCSSTQWFSSREEGWPCQDSKVLGNPKGTVEIPGLWDMTFITSFRAPGSSTSHPITPFLLQIKLQTICSSLNVNTSLYIHSFVALQRLFPLAGMYQFPHPHH